MKTEAKINEIINIQLAINPCFYIDKLNQLINLI